MVPLQVVVPEKIEDKTEVVSFNRAVVFVTAGAIFDLAMQSFANLRNSFLLLSFVLSVAAGLSSKRAWIGGLPLGFGIAKIAERAKGRA